ncbi:restriction endonuclease subunit S [uncultured Varibaculum sp.]|uniref:restriction endonuclease subunit S n=1 Tax=uncultured Varibaculum sp. TaxID=413896 RepID=UPI002803D0B3|nr:restriction endonuclease subunit S [uncultured Varibaculum sp.]
MSQIEDLIAKHCPNGVDEKLISDVAELERGKYISKKTAIPGDIPVIAGGRGPAYWHNEANRSGELLTVAGSGAYAGFVQYWDSPIFVSDAFSIITNPQVNTRFLYHWLKNQQDFLHSLKKGSGVAHVYPKDIAKLKIPVPPLEVQEEIVRILDSFTNLEANLQTELEARRQQYKYYRDSLLTLQNLASRLGEENVKLTPLGEIGAVKMCKRILKNQTAKAGDIPFYKIGTFGKEPNAYIDSNIYEKLKKKYPFPRKGNILISASGTIGNTVIYNGEPAYFQDSNIVWLEHDESIVLDKYLYYVYQMNPWVVPEGGTIKRLYNDIILKTKIPVPPLSEQERIVAILDKFDALVNDLSSGLPAEITARRKQYEYYRDRLLTFTPAK